MKKLGISIYPNGDNRQAVLDYLGLAASYGFKRVFTCLISASGGKAGLMETFGELGNHARGLGMEVVADVDPQVFTDLGLTIEDLSFFKEAGLSGIRLDMGFSGAEEAMMSYNAHGIKLELNASNGTRYIDNILSLSANKSQLLGCHNFYPHPYTGLSREHFIKCSKQFKDLGIRTAAFISSAAADHGPWPVNEGLCTLEEHRRLPLTTQAKDLWNTGVIDDVIIGNAFASEEELKALSKLNPEILTLCVEAVEDLDGVEEAILFDTLHFNRGDVSDYVVRSTESREIYRDHFFKPRHLKDIQKGDVVIESSLYKRYAGELHLARLPMANSGKTNVVGRITEHEVFLVDQIQPWQKFKLTGL